MEPTTKASGSQRILVNVPILNEIQNIEQLVTGIQEALDGLDYVLLIVDDGSTDGTLEYLDKVIPSSNGKIVVLRNKKTMIGCQRGAALLVGVNWGLDNGDFDIFIEMDGDLSHRTEELRAGIDVIAGDLADVAIASKYVPGSKITGRTAGRTTVSIICNLLVRTVIQWRILDFSNGYRFYNRRAAESIPRHRIRYGSPIYLTEVMAIWLTHRLRIVEIASHYVGRHEGFSKVILRDYVKAAIGILEISLRYRIFGFAPNPAEDKTGR
jgi:dolichol-phosphate mannosyltransferase